MTVIGVVGSPWRASVSATGSVVPWDGSPALDWWVAADDRWHAPAIEPAVRQRRRRGAPVIETSLRVPEGDVIHRAYAVADRGGLAVVEVENASPLPVAVAFSRSDLLTARPASGTPALGIELPVGATVWPVAHRTTLTVALAHARGDAGRLPGRLPGPDDVARGWVAQTEAGMRLVGLDEADDHPLVAARASLLLEGPSTDDDVAFLLGVGELVRLGEPAEPWVLDAVARAEAVVAGARRSSGPVAWDVDAALEATAAVLRRAGEDRAVGDVTRMAARLGPRGPLPEEAPTDDARLAWWWRRRFVTPIDDGADVLAGLPSAWIGRDVASYGVPVAAGHVSFALRWHGRRPALLWEAEPAITLRATRLDPRWSTTAASGEALLSPIS